MRFGTIHVIDTLDRVTLWASRDILQVHRCPGQRERCPGQREYAQGNAIAELQALQPYSPS